MCADPANFTDPDGRAGIPFLQDFKKSMLGECVVGSIQALGGAFGIAGLMSIGGTIGNVVSGVLSIGTTANSIKNMAQLANEGSKVGQGGSFNMSNELIGEINSHGNVGMRFSGARNEGGVDGDPKKKQSSDLLYKPVSQPSDRLYTTAEMERNLLYSNLYKGFMPEPPVSAFQLYKENEINLMQMFYRWDQSFSDAARVPFTIFAEMLPPVSLYMSYTGRDLNNNPLSTTGRCFAAAGGFLGIGELKFALNGAAKGGTTFFEGASYSSKVLKQMGKADDLFHGFPKSVDGLATKFGQWSTKLGADGKPYQWLKMPGSYGGKTGVFEYTKDANGLINHRFFNIPK